MVKKLISEIENVSIFKKFGILVKIVQHFYSNRDKEIFRYFQKTIELIDNYLTIENHPDDSIKKDVSAVFSIVFRFIKNSESLELFNKYYPIYQKYSYLISDYVARAEILQSLGFLFWLEHNHKKSIEVLEESLRLINEYGKPSDIPNRYTNLGFVYENTGNYNKAEIHYQDGLIFAQKNNSQEALLMAYAAMGRLNFHRKKYNQAIFYYQEALELSADEEQNENILSIKANLGCSFQKLKDYDKAFEIYDELKSSEIKGNYPGLYNTVLANIANLYMEENDLEKAENILHESLNYGKKFGAIEFVIGTKMNMAIVHYRREEYDLAESLIIQAIDDAQRHDNKRMFFDSLMIYGDILTKLNHCKNAIEKYEECRKYFTDEKNYNHLTKLYSKLTNCYGTLKDYKSAYKTAKKYIETRDILDNEKLTKEEKAENQSSKNFKPNFHNFKNANTLISIELVEKMGYPLLGRSSAMEKVIKEAFLAASIDNVNIHLNGESGTGKELIARLIHFSSKRKNNKFVAVNSAYLNSGLVQSSLFGHTKGAFTGANSKEIGFFELANRGTLFLDEIGDMPINIQAVFLRVLEEKIIMPVGSTKTKPVDFRLISATHKDIHQMIQEDMFRLDFFNRINSITINIPPLRERKEDIPLLINYFLHETSNEIDKEAPKISLPAINSLCDYDYPGNVRELYNIIRRLVLFSPNGEITIDDVLMIVKSNKNMVLQNDIKTFNLAQMEEETINQAMKKAGNVQNEAAKLLGISIYALHRKLKKMREKNS
ncbi:MAG: sigma 54-interacting transcriptional regulator [Candidatus Cloacimonetes bacterium]|nr:sigma 54-interacting transcriptional regulator [Candidatus Cloacimonadota bacterium]